MSERIVLGLSVGVTSSAAVMVNGRIVACASEERYNRLKNYDGWPFQAINDCLSMAGLSAQDIDVVAWGMQSAPKSDEFLTHRNSRFGVGDYLREQESYWYPRLYEERKIDFLDVFAEKIDLDQFPGPELLAPIVKIDAGEEREAAFAALYARMPTLHLGIPQGKMVFLPHHACHAAYALHGMPHPDLPALIVTLDGMGDGENATVWRYANGALAKLFGTADFLLGRYYRHVTLLLGMKMSEDEFKVMGLSSYAKPYHSDQPYRVFSEALRLNGRSIGSATRPRDAFFHFRDRLKECRFDGIAGGLQRFTDELVTNWISSWMTHTGERRVHYSGGVSMNIKANMEVVDHCDLDAFHVPGSGGDESLAIGACYLYAMRQGWKVEPLETLYLGSAIKSEVDRATVTRAVGTVGGHVVENVGPNRIAEEIAAGRILGRCCGRMEFGARALGNRSILADPRNPRINRTLNDKVKGRDFWMPFAPVVLKERQHDYLVVRQGVNYGSMTVGARTTNEGIQAIPAALHAADDTARPQILCRDANPDYYDLVSAFERVTGVGALLNTSCNIHGLPIVRTAADAMHVLEATDIDGIVVGDTMILKDGKPPFHKAG